MRATAITAMSTLKLHVVEETTSTMDTIKDYLVPEAIEFQKRCGVGAPNSAQLGKEQKKYSDVIGLLAQTQTKGRGTGDRPWVSPLGNLYYTVAIHRDNIPDSFLPCLPLLVGLSIREAILEFPRVCGGFVPSSPPQKPTSAAGSKEGESPLLSRQSTSYSEGGTPNPNAPAPRSGKKAGEDDASFPARAPLTVGGDGGFCRSGDVTSPPRSDSALLVERKAALEKWQRDLLTSGIHLKWPNDVIHDSKKLAGSLITEHTLDNLPFKPSYMLIGIGVNIDVAPYVGDEGRESTCLRDIVALEQVESFSSEADIFKMESELLVATTPEELAELARLFTTKLMCRLEMAHRPGAERMDPKKIFVKEFEKYMARNVTLHRRLEGGRRGEKLLPVRLTEWGQLVARNARGEEVTLTSEYLF